MNDEHNPGQHQTAEGQRSPRDCPPFETLSLFFDGELDAAEAAKVEAHVASCDSCQAVLDDLRLIRQALRVSTPVASTRPFRLTPDDVRETRPVLQPVKPDTSAPARRLTRLTIPYVPALTAVAALLLIAIIAGDVISGDDGPGSGPTPTAGAADVIVIDGTPILTTEEDRDGNFGAAASTPMSGQTANDGSESIESASKSDPFWDWWRIGEALLIVILLGLLVTALLQRRSRRSASRNRA